MIQDQFRYSRKMIDELLPDAVNPNWSGEMPIPLSQYNDGAQMRVSKPISERGDWLAMVLDVRRAIKAGRRDVDSITRYLNGQLEEYASEQEPDSETQAEATAEAEA